MTLTDNSKYPVSSQPPLGPVGSQANAVSVAAGTHANANKEAVHHWDINDSMLPMVSYLTII